jgi:hypothetical protein
LSFTEKSFYQEFAQSELEERKIIFQDHKCKNISLISYMRNKDLVKESVCEKFNNSKVFYFLTLGDL